MTNTPQIIIFDGICRFCNGSVKFIIKRDPKGVFAFAPLQSDVAKQLIEAHCLSEPNADSILLIKNGTCYLRSDAALEIAKNLAGLWPVFGIFKLIPRPIRDFAYDLIAQNRYKLFGQQAQCMIPTPDIKRRFIG